MYWSSLLFMQMESKPEPPETYHNFSMDFGGMPGTLLPETNCCCIGKSQGLNFKDLHTQSRRLHLHDKLSSIRKM